MRLFPQPTRHPGAILREDFLPSLEVTHQSEIAEMLGVSRPRLSELLNGSRSVTPDTALRLARVFGTSAEFWLDAQARWELEQARKDRPLMREIDALQPRLEARPELGGGWAGSPGTTLRAAAHGVRADHDAEEREQLYRQFLRKKGLLEEADRFVRVRDRRELFESIMRSAEVAVAGPR